MPFLISIFLASFFASAGMLFFRSWQMRKGKVPMPFPSSVDVKYRLLRNCAIWEKKIWDESRHWSIRLSTQALRGAVFAIDRIRIEMRKLIAKMEEGLMKKYTKDPQGAPSFFLKEIGEHKKKMRLGFGYRKKEKMHESEGIDKP